MKRVRSVPSTRSGSVSRRMPQNGFGPSSSQNQTLQPYEAHKQRTNEADVPAVRSGTTAAPLVCLPVRTPIRARLFIQTQARSLKLCGCSLLFRFNEARDFESISLVFSILFFSCSWLFLCVKQPLKLVLGERHCPVKKKVTKHHEFGEPLLNMTNSQLLADIKTTVVAAKLIASQTV